METFFRNLLSRKNLEELNNDLMYYIVCFDRFKKVKVKKKK